MSTSVETDNPVPTAPVKAKEEFRDYNNDKNERMNTVRQFYKDSHTYQTMEYVLRKKKELETRLTAPVPTLELSIWEAFAKLDNIVDDSDPDTALPQSVHALQTAEILRQNPELQQYDWLPLVGLIHDLGKVMLLIESDMPQWSVVGDTFPVGCKFEDTCIYHEYFALNPDSANTELNTKYGIYAPNCGFDNVHFAHGHDEYMYQICKFNDCKLPEEALYIIRYHSFYPFHNKGGYQHLANKKDQEYVKWLQLFQKHDLYSKLPEVPDPKKLKPIYDALVKKYFPTEKLRW